MARSELFTGININLKYQIKIKEKSKLLTDPTFQKVNRLFLLSFEDQNNRISYSNDFVPKIE